MYNGAYAVSWHCAEILARTSESLHLRNEETAGWWRVEFCVLGKRKQRKKLCFNVFVLQQFEAQLRVSL